LVPLFLCLALFGFWGLAPLLSVLAKIVSIPEDTVSIAFRILVVLLAVIVVLFAATQRRHFAPVIPLLIFSAIYLYRLYDNYFIENFQLYVSYTLSFSMFLGAGILPSLAIFVAAGHLTKNETAFRNCMIAVMLIFLFGIWLNADLLFERTVVQASLERVNQIGLTSMAMTFAIFSLLHLRNPSLTIRGLLVACLLGCAIIVTLAKARGPLVGSAVALIVFFLIVRGQYKIQFVAALTVCAMVLIGLQIYTGNSLLEDTLSRFDYVADGGAGDSVTPRKLAWTAAWEQFLDDPVLGRFIFEKANNYYPHNIILEVLMATGVLGAGFFFWHLMLTFKAATFLLRQPTLALSSAFIVIIFLKEFVQSLFSGSVWGASSFLVSSCCIIGISHYSKTTSKSRQKNLHQAARI
jgi:O-Antigen ligase